MGLKYTTGRTFVVDEETNRVVGIADPSASGDSIQYLGVADQADPIGRINESALMLTSSGLQIGGAAPTVEQQAAVRAGIGANLANKSIMWIGDSHTASGASSRHPLAPHDRGHYLKEVFTNINAYGGFIRYSRISPDCPVGTGTVRYYASDDTLSWQAPGDTEGAKVSAASGFIVAESGTLGRPIYLACLSRFKPTVDTSDTQTIALTNLPSITRCNLSGFSGWAELLLGCPFDTSLNYGISGATTSEMYAFNDTYKNVYTDVTVIHLGTNQSDTLSAAQQSIADLENIINLRKSIGSVVVVCTLFPANNLTATSAGAKLWHRNATNELCKRLGVMVADGYSYLADPLSAVGAYRATDVRSDDVHLSAKGAYIFAKKALVPVLSKILSVSGTKVNGGTLFNSSTCPSGNLLANGVFSGTSGTKGTRVTGDMATSWTASMGSGSVASTVATAPQSVSPIARTDGFPGNVMRLHVDNTGGVANETLTMYQSTFVSSSNYSVGDKVVGEVEVSIDPNGVLLFAVHFGTTNFKSHAISMRANDNMYDLDGDTVSVVARSFPLRIESGQSELNASVYAYMAADGVLDLSLTNVALRKV